MKDFYDVIVVGGSSSGSYFARNMAKQGFSVLIIEKDAAEKISSGYDIFHMSARERNSFDLPEVKPGDGVYEFEYKESFSYSALGNYPKYGDAPVIGMHRHEYMLMMNAWARKSGAEILYEADFSGLVYTYGRISGVRFRHGGVECVCSCRLVADCSGKSAVVRTALPDDYGIETRPLTEKDVFFVKLRYIKFREPQAKKWMKSQFYLYYKTWLAPCGDDADCILGIGSSLGYDNGDRVYEEFLKNIKIPPFDVVKEELGTTPYHRPLYSFVSDGFIALGDAAWMTKANNGEGCIAQLPLEDIAADLGGKVLKREKYPTRELLWKINKAYYSGPGRDAVLMLAALSRAANHSLETNEWLFKNDTIFADKILCESAVPKPLTAGDILRMAGNLIKGTLTRKVSGREIRFLLSGAVRGIRIYLHYLRYPSKAENFKKWSKKSAKLWKKTGQMSDWSNTDSGR